MCSILGRSVSLFVVAAITACGQSPVFEVASIKLSDSGRNGVSGGCHGVDSHYAPNEVAAAPPLGRCVIHDGRLSHMLGTAFSLRMDMIKGGPDWVMTGIDRFDLEAKAEDTAHVTEKQLHDMLQALLVERFQIKYHRENIQTQGFALVVGKNGPKFHESRSEDVDLSMTDKDHNFTKPSPGQLAIVVAKGYTMAQLANYLSIFGRGPVIDKTGLTSKYDFQLSWDDTNGPTLPSALQQDLGLRLEPQKVPQSLLVIESAQKPSAN